MDNEQLGMVIGIVGAVLIIAGLGLNLTGGLVESESFMNPGYISDFDTPSKTTQGDSMNLSFKSKIYSMDANQTGHWVIKVGPVEKKTKTIGGEEQEYYKPVETWDSKSFNIDTEEKTYDWIISIPSGVEPGGYKLGIWSEAKSGVQYLLRTEGDKDTAIGLYPSDMLPVDEKANEITVQEKAEEDSTVTLDYTGEGAVSGEGTYKSGKEATITASAESGWKFVKWEGDIKSDEKEHTFTVDEDVTATAVFEEKDSTTDDSTDNDSDDSTDSGDRDDPEQYVLSVQKEPNWGGTIEETGESGEEQELYEEGTKVAVEASTNPNFEFTGWSGDISSDSKTASVTMDSDKDITAGFEEMEQEEEEYDLTIKVNGEGTTDPSEGVHTYDYGEVPTIEANPDEGYVFDGWDDGSSESTKSVVMDDNKTMTANFKSKSADEVTLTMITSPSEGGSINLTHAEEVTLDKGETIQLEAFSNEGYAFESWDVGAESFQDKHITYVIEEDTTATAHFNEKESPVEIFKKYLGWILTGGGVVLIGGAFFVAKML